MELTKQNLIDHFGMVETEGDEKEIFPLRKVISVNDQDEEIAGLSICISYLYNDGARPCLLMPDGDIIWIYANSIEDLQKFESSIAMYEPTY